MGQKLHSHNRSEGWVDWGRGGGGGGGAQRERQRVSERERQRERKRETKTETDKQSGRRTDRYVEKNYGGGVGWGGGGGGVMSVFQRVCQSTRETILHTCLLFPNRARQRG